MYDLLLKGGRVYDGSGLPAFNADVAIADGRIQAVGRINAPAKRTLNVDEPAARRRLPLGLKYPAYAGPCAVRQYASEDYRGERPASEDEIRQMEQLVRDAMEAGSFGFSTNMNDRHFREDGKPIPSRLAER